MFLVAFSLSMLLHASLSSKAGSDICSGILAVDSDRWGWDAWLLLSRFRVQLHIYCLGAEIWKIMRICVCLRTLRWLSHAKGLELCGHWFVFWQEALPLASCLPMLTLWWCLMRLLPMHLRPDWVSNVKRYLQLSIIFSRKFWVQIEKLQLSFLWQTESFLEIV